jgi:hypothetical protein
MNEERLRRQRRTILVGLYVLFMLIGGATAVVDHLPPNETPPDLVPRIDLLLAIPTCLSFMWLCTVDAKLVGKPLIQLAKLGIFLGWPIGVPIYLLWARGARGLGLFLLHGLLMLLVAICTMLAVVFVFFGRSLRV